MCILTGKYFLGRCTSLKFCKPRWRMVTSSFSHSWDRWSSIFQVCRPSSSSEGAILSKGELWSVSSASQLSMLWLEREGGGHPNPKPVSTVLCSRSQPCQHPPAWLPDAFLLQHFQTSTQRYSNKEHSYFNFAVHEPAEFIACTLLEIQEHLTLNCPCKD